MADILVTNCILSAPNTEDTMYSSIFKIILFTFVFYKTTEAAVELFSPQDKPAEFADQSGCFHGLLNVVIKIGIPYSPQDGTTCDRYVCNEDNGVIQRHTCSPIAVGEGCKEIEGDKKLPYPDCCNTVLCPEEDGTCTDAK